MIIDKNFKAELITNRNFARDLANNLSIILSVINNAEDLERDLTEAEKEYVIPKIKETEAAINSLKQLI